MKSLPLWARQDYPPKRPLQGHVYLIFCAGLHKVGKTRDLESRIRGYQTALPGGVTLVHSFAADNMDEAEKVLHTRFGSKRRNGEWFALAPEDVTYIQNIGGYEGGRWTTSWGMEVYPQ